jgi:hypothetical protein
MKKLIFLILITASVTGYSQKLHKLEGIDEMPLTLNPVIFNPDLDSTITFIEFLQDTTKREYEYKNYSSIGKEENLEQVVGVGLIGDYKIDHKTVSVIIKTHHTNGEVKYFTYTEKIDKLSYYLEEFKWAAYSIDIDIYYEGEEDEVHSL